MEKVVIEITLDGMTIDLMRALHSVECAGKSADIFDRKFFKHEKEKLIDSFGCIAFEKVQQELFGKKERATWK